MSGELQLEEKIKKITMAVYRVTDLIGEQEHLRFKIRELSDKIFEYSIRVLSNSLSVEERRNFFYNSSNEFVILRRFVEISHNHKFLKPDNFDIIITEYQLFFNQLKNLIVNYEQQQVFFASMIDMGDIERSEVQDAEISVIFSNGDNSHKHIDFFEKISAPKGIIKASKIKPENKDLTIGELGNNGLSYRLKERHQKITDYLQNQPDGCHRQDLIKGLDFERDPRTLSRDLEYLNNQGIIERKGDRKGAVYFLKQNNVLETKLLSKFVN